MHTKWNFYTVTKYKPFRHYAHKTLLLFKKSYIHMELMENIVLKYEWIWDAFEWIWRYLFFDKLFQA